MLLTILSLWILLVNQTVWGMHFPFGKNNDYSSVSHNPLTVAKSYEAFLSDNESLENFNASSNQTEDDNAKYTQVFTSDGTPRTDENNSTLSSSNQSVSSSNSTSVGPSTSDIHTMETLTTILSNESHSQSSTEFSSSESSAATNEGTLSGTKSSILTTPSNNETKATSLTTDEDEPEGVARGKPTTTESVNTTTKRPQTLYEKGLALIGDPYYLGILIPVIAGIFFASTIMITMAICRCITRRCVRRRLRRKALPDSVKNLRPSDRARLLAESSDEEF